MTTFQTSNPSTSVILAPSYNIPIVLTLSGIPLIFLSWWLSLLITIFGLFLMFQTVNIRLHFTPSALDIYRRENLIRSFPYTEWENWRIFWQPFPILFYFKEVKSIHFLPILFDPKTLKTCLEKNITILN